jgi:D-aspartate ligase
MPLIDVDRAVPALMVKIGYYPVQAGGVGVVRSLGRLGVPVHVIAEDPFTSLALSRYRARRFGWRTTGLEPTDVLVAGLADIGRRIGTRCVAIPTDDEAAILLAEHAAELSEYFLFPRVDPALPRRLASKHDLFLLCREHNVPAPAAALVSSRAELVAHAEQVVFPLVVKNGAPWVRLRARMVGSTTVLHTRDQLLALAETEHEDFRLLIQEYIPREHAQDWIVHVYCDASSDCLALFTALKLRSWPAHAGNTACAYATFNPVLADLAGRFCKAVGFRGVADLDWRYDQRDGRYKLVDFNPRVGNNFSLFQTRGGIDVVRALHLDLTRRNVPADEQVDGRRLVVEHYDLAARMAYRKAEPALPVAAERAATTVRAFASLSDPLPFLGLWPRQASQLMSRVSQLARSRMRSRATSPAGQAGLTSEPGQVR